MFKKSIVLILMMFVFVTFLSTSSYSKVTIRWWGIVGGPQGEALKAMANKYMKINPEVSIEIREGSLGLTDVAAFLAAISAKQTPELLYWDRFTVAEFAARGAFTPLDELISSSKVINKKDMYTYALKEASFKGHIYAIPHDAATHGLAINVIHYKEAGLDPSKPPRDFEEFILYAKKLTKYDDKGNIVRCGVEAGEYFTDPTPLVVLMKSVGADWVSIDGKKCTVNDPKIVKALDAIVRLC
ncbi:MAG: extracellular solute-binding protein, partial [bacterium]